jgi:hypothetical protein
MRRQDPGPCPICGAAHTVCTAPGPAGIVIDQLPAKTALEVAVTLEVPPPVEFSTTSYDRAKQGPPDKRKPR